MTDWASLQDAYGSAERVPALLESARSSGAEFGEAWNDLWSHLCHQGTVFSASYAAIPSLTDICLRQHPVGYTAALHLAGAILAATDGPENRADVRGRYQSEIADLRALAEQALATTADDTQFIYALEALMAFEDGGIWQRSLNCLADGEAPLRCPRCEGDLLLCFTEPVRTICARDASIRPTQVRPLEPSAGSVESRLLDLARANSRQAVAAELSYLFGEGTCPNCGTTFRSSDGLN